MKKILFSASILLFTMCTSCDLGLFGKKEPQTELEKLPPITQTGENTFGCLVNGEAMTITKAYKMTAIYQGGFIQFGGGGIYMLVPEPLTIDTEYPLIDKARFTEDDDGPASCYYDFENTYEGTVTFSKIDQENYIISGKFKFSTVKQGCDTLRVTDGRFDMQYTP